MAPLRRPRLIAGNWKMNTTVSEALALVERLLPGLGAYPEVEQALLPPFVSLPLLAERLRGTAVQLGAQDLHWEKAGAYTGEISAAMLHGICRYVIVGHSERRTYFGETDESVRRKALAALAQGLRPIVCVGETLDEREAGVAEDVVRRQLGRGLEGVGPDSAADLVIAYEPVWAIGTGRAATTADADGMISRAVRPALQDRLGPQSEAIRVLYGGSLTAVNAAQFFAESSIDGALVGGASLKADEFIAIVAAAAGAER